MSISKKKILAISGSTRKNSSNGQLLQAISLLTTDDFDITPWEGLSDLPPFNPDYDYADNPAIGPVLAFRQLLKDADGVVICTPEYAHGVPGALKNAIDWTVSSGEFSGKPTVLITASTDGKYAHQALLETLKVIEAKNIGQLQLLIPFIKTKLSGDHITDEKTLVEVRALMEVFKDTLTTILR